MSLHSTYFAGAGIEQLLRTQGEPITLVAKDGTRSGMTALESSEESTIEHDQRGRKVKRTPKFTITKDPSSAFGGAADPQENGTLVWEEKEYAIKTRTDCGTHWELRCVYTARTERARPGFRAAEA